MTSYVMRLGALILYRALVLTCFCLIRKTGSCPPSCRCDATSVACSGLTEFPADLPGNLTQLTITDSRMPVVSRERLLALPDLEVLQLTGNAIHVIENGTFMDHRKLYYVSLEANGLTAIEGSTFANTNIQRLFLSDNPGLRAIAADAFDNATVDKLYIRNCSISGESLDNVLTSLHRYLDTLDVSRNAKTLLFDRDLLAGSRFQSLVLRDNRIRDPSFLDTVTVDMLDLSGNPLGDSAWNVTNYVPRVKELILENVGVTSLTPKSPGQFLLVLNLAGNNVSGFSGDDLRLFPNIQTLILKNNAMTSIPRDLSRRVGQLAVLDVSGNRLSALDPESLSGLNLWVLNASNNIITTLSGSLRDLFDRIRIIDLTENPFHCNCQITWLADWLRHLAPDRGDVTFGRCRTPPEHAGSPIWILDPDALTCTSPVVLLLAAGGHAAGDRLTVECKGKADPAARLQLYRDQALLEAAVTADRLEQQTSLEYHVTDFGCDDVGNYTCLASNMAGVDADWAIIGEQLSVICYQNNGSIPSETNDVTTPATGDVITQPSTGGSTYLIPVIVVVIAIGVIGVIVASLLWRRRTRRKYHFRSAEGGNNNTDNMCYANSAFDRGQGSNSHVTPTDDAQSHNGHVTSATPDVS